MCTVYLCALPVYCVCLCAGNLPLRFREIFRRNENFIGMRLPEPRELEPIERRLPLLHSHFKDIVKVSVCIAYACMCVCVHMCVLILYIHNVCMCTYVCAYTVRT